MKGEVVMKRMYEKPMAYEEVFKANEYIALISNTTKLRVIQDYVYWNSRLRKKDAFYRWFIALNGRF